MVNVTRTFPSTMVGFDRLFDEIEHQLNRSTDGFPKHNLIKLNETKYIIELAVAGCREKDLNVELKENTLTITGQKRPDSKSEYLHKGITSKEFTRTFRLAEHTVVDSADLQHGILSIWLRVELPTEKQPRTIPINGKTTERELLNG